MRLDANQARNKQMPVRIVDVVRGTRVSAVSGRPFWRRRVDSNRVPHWIQTCDGSCRTARHWAISRVTIASGIEPRWKGLPMNCARFPRLLLAAVLLLALPAASFAAVFVSVTVAPPPIPVYVQPVCPSPGYMWTPGYWAWGDLGYYWVPGTWVPAPAVGLLWTPGYWGWSGGYYRWNGGYWGPHIGFYGGVNYGY